MKLPISLQLAGSANAWIRFTLTIKPACHVKLPWLAVNSVLVEIFVVVAIRLNTFTLFLKTKAANVWHSKTECWTLTVPNAFAKTFTFKTSVLHANYAIIIRNAEFAQTLTLAQLVMSSIIGRLQIKTPAFVCLAIMIMQDKSASTVEYKDVTCV